MTTLAVAEYTIGAQFSSDGQLYLNFYVTAIDLDAMNQLTFTVNYVAIPMGTTTEDLVTTVADAIRAEAENQGFTIDANKLTMPNFIQA